jgi:hypothetical protein
MDGDKGKAPAFREQSATPDYGNIGVPKDGMGYDVGIKKVGVNLSDAGNANYTEPVKKVAGKNAAM